MISNKRMRQFFMSAACTLLGAFTYAQAAEPVVTLRLATINIASAATFKLNMEPYARAIERDSGGRIKVQLGVLNQFGRPTELYPKVVAGEIEMAATVQGYHAGAFPRSAVLELPLMYRTALGGTRALWQLHEEGALGDEYAKVKLLTIYMLPPYPIFFTEKQAKSVRDLRGQRVRVPSPTVALAAAKLGIVPIGLTVNLLGDAITNDALDGFAFGWDTIFTTRAVGDTFLISHVKHGLDIGLAAPALMMVMNRKVYDDLAPELRAAIDKNSGLKLAEEIAGMRDEWEDKARERIRQSSAHTYYAFSEAQRREVQTIINPAIDEWVASTKAQGFDGAKLLARSRELIAKFEKPTN
jgi:TRAP-type C4-dicarboxylate transport system substrate-binding protein